MPNRTQPHTPNARAREKRAKDWAPAFLAALKGATVSTAAAQAGVGRRTVYDRRERDSEFKQAWEDALEESIEELEAEAVRRAKAGSDQLLMFLLRARRPKVYSERYRIQHSGRIEAPPVMLDIRDPEVRAKSRDLLHAVAEARERRLAEEGK